MKFLVCVLTALMEDWASKARPDILHFVPYTWHFSLILKEFELITIANEYNWIDCSSQHQENSETCLFYVLQFSLKEKNSYNI